MSLLLHTRLLAAALALACLSLQAASGTSASPLPTAAPDAEGFSPERLARLHERLRGYVDKGQHAGISMLLVRDGHVVDRHAWGHRDREAGLPMEQDTIVRIYSMTKIVTSVALMQLHEQALVRLDDPVETYLPALSKRKVLTGGTARAPVLAAAKRSVTMKDLLTHTAGYIYPFMFTKGPLDELYRDAGVGEAGSTEAFLERLARVPLAHQPGARFSYGVNTDVIGAVVETISGLSLEEYVARHITGPLRMVDTAFHVPPQKRTRLAKTYRLDDEGRLTPLTDTELGMTSLEPGGMHWGGAGLFSTIDDYARFGQMLLNGGALDGARVLGRKSVELMLANALTHTPTPHTQFSENQGFGYGGGVRIDLARGNGLGSPGQFGWTGAASTYFNMDPHERTLALVFTQHFPHDQHGMFATFSTLFYASLVDPPSWQPRAEGR
jgi:CubicO group peptidase (beta-lactamase class C family)